MSERDLPPEANLAVTADPGGAPEVRVHAEDLRGVVRLAVAATRGVTGIVEEMHQIIGSGPAILGRPLAVPTRLATAATYGTIHGITAGIGKLLDQSLSFVSPVLGSSKIGPQREAIRSLLGGIVGDMLAETGNPLTIPMRLRSGGRALPMEAEALRALLGAERAASGKRTSEAAGPGGKLAVLIHGLCLNDRHWNRRGRDPGAVLRELGYVPLYLHYNSGLHISQNGEQLAGLLEQLVAAWPEPVAELALIGHSMGGLVARSASAHAERSGHGWRRALRALVCLGSPHHGAPLERGGNWIDVLLGVFEPSRPLARLGQLRSAGVTDLRFGNVLPEHWQGLDRFAFGGDDRIEAPLPEGVRCFAVAAQLFRRGVALLGDGLVPVDSALGRHGKLAHTLAFPEAHQLLIEGAGHIELLDHPEVAAALRRWLGPS
jgi:pimeloyl-ACP methyl ester carboxylesterase